MTKNDKNRKPKKMLVFTLTLTLIAAAALAAFAVATTEPPLKEGETAMPILMYHSVTRDESLTSAYVVTEAQFESDMKYLRDNGYNAVFVSEIADFVLSGTPLPEKPIAITLDDGYVNNLSYVLPLLAKYDMKATISIVGACSESAAADRYDNMTFAHMSFAEAAALQESGYVEIGNHTYSMHENVSGARRGCTRMSGESEEDYKAALRADLSKLQGYITQCVNINATTFTYPFGKISPESTDVLKELGFTAALTCNPGINHLSGDPDELLALKRLNRPGSTTTEKFMEKLPY